LGDLGLAELAEPRFGEPPSAPLPQKTAELPASFALIPRTLKRLSHRNQPLSTGAAGCNSRHPLLFSGSREMAHQSRLFAICIEEWPVLLLKSCRCSSGASRWPLWPAPSGEVGSRFVGRTASNSASSPCRESRREQTHCMTREEIPFVRAKCARRFVAGCCLKFCAVRPSAAGNYLPFTSIE
jgi:hypothetical protein